MVIQSINCFKYMFYLQNNPICYGYTNVHFLMCAAYTKMATGAICEMQLFTHNIAFSFQKS